MAMDRTEYPAMLASLQPGQAVDVLNDRVGQVGKLNTEIANWLQERRRLEELYSNGLRKLARKNIDAADLGVFAAPWTTLTNSAENLAESHSALAAKIEVDVERPLRDFVGSNREMQSMSNMQGNLGSIARDVDRAKQKAEKLQGRGDKADTNKVANASSDLDNAQVQWESQAPYVFESLQAIDETRWNHLRDVLTQFQTHEVDQVEKHRVSAEQVLNQLLNVETADEIKTFALRTIENKPAVRRPVQSSSTSTALAAASSTPSRGFGGGTPLSPTISQPDEAASQRSASIQEPEKKKGPLKGLKRLGTVMGRRRESKMPQQLEPMAESPERKPKSSPFNSFSNRLGRSKDPNLEAPSEGSQPRPRSPLRMGSEVLEAPPSRPSQALNVPAPPPSRRPHSGVNGVTAATGGAAMGAAGAAAVHGIPNGSHQGDLADLEPPAPAQPEPVQQPTIQEPQRDSEGYSMPPSDVDPITLAQQEAANAGEDTPPQFNVNIRDAPIQEDRGADAAMADMASKLQMQAPTLNPRRLGTVRGRREARNSFVPPPVDEQQAAPVTAPIAASAPTYPIAEAAPIERAAPVAEPGVAPIDAISPLQPAPTGSFAPGQVAASTFSPFPSSAESTSPFRPTSRAAQLGTDHTGDNQSIRSGRSLTSTGSQGHRHADLHETGLNASIVETVSARFENGQLSSTSLIGEVALAYNAPDFSTPFGTETIRLENFGSLEKVAPNPAFIIPAPSREGEYSVSLASLSKTQVAFKYQVSSDLSGSQAPLLIAPAFKIEPTQASIIISYSLNPSFALHGRSSITLSSVILALTLEGAKATSCLSKPVGTFAREKNLIYWNIGDLTLTPGVAPTKLLARFATESEAKSGSVEARWEISGEHAQGLGSALSVSAQGQPGGVSDGADPFADEEGLTAVWKGVQGVRKLASGAYTAK